MIFLNSARSAAALVFYLPGVCTHADNERKQSPEYFKIFGNNTIFNEHPVCYTDYETPCIIIKVCFVFRRNNDKSTFILRKSVSKLQPHMCISLNKTNR